MLALTAAREGIVLLKNVNNTLPLARSKVATIAAVGPHADATDIMQGIFYLQFYIV
jgi:beta-glucosidase-like glycosyl hydrolase